MRQPHDTPSHPAPPSAAGKSPPTLRTSPPVDQPTSELSPQGATLPAADAALLPAHPGRYQLGEEVGRGGMGAVLRAHDPRLGRELAVKVLRGDGHGDPQLLRRFVEEAQVCSQLQHPGIVPVHDLGRLEDGRPFFAMKLVKGRTLATLLRERASPAADLPRFLGIFEAVCQAVGYAHSKGVLHRDLKSANVMVGAFGEVQVMDWGLAKVLRPQGDAPAAAPEGVATVIRTVRSASGEETGDGQAMGTPAYMAPEQARGEVESLDERCDVFGLGAVLCEILTGRPPFAVGSREEAHARAMCADLADAFARLDRCGADVELVRLTKACLAADREARPRDGGAVAAAVTAYQRSVQGRLRRAELGRARAQVLAAAVLAAVALAAGGGLWLQQQRAERQAEAARQAEALRQEVGAVLGQAARFRQAGHFREGLELLEQAQKRLGASGPADLREQVEQALADTGLAKRLDALRLRTFIFMGGMKPGPAEAEYAEALRQAGLGREGEAAGTVAARVRASAVREEVVAALDDYAGITQDEARREWLLAVARAADPDPDRDRLRQPALWRDKAALARLAGEARGAGVSPQLPAALGRALLRSGGDAVPLLRAAQERHPGDFWLNFQLGIALNEAKEWDEAIGYWQAALALRPRFGGTHVNLGVALSKQGKREEAVRHYEEALRLDPKNAMAHNNLGVFLRDKGQVDEAFRHFEQALRIDPKLALTHVNLGRALRAKGQVDEAVRHFEAGLRLDPKDAQAHYNLGNALYQQGKLDEAVGHWEEALRLDPKHTGAHVSLGTILCDVKGDPDGAMAHFQKAIALDPKNAQAHSNLGIALAKKGRLEEAVGHFEQALHLDPKYARAHYSLGNALRDTGQADEAVGHWEEALRLDPKHAGAHVNLGLALAKKGQVDEAIRYYQEALRLDPKQAGAHINLGLALRAKGRADEAIRHYQEALKIDPKLLQAHGAFGDALQGKGQVEEAISHYQEVLKIDPQNARAHYSLGTALSGKGKVDEAISHYRQAIHLNPKYAEAHCNLGRSLQQQGHFEESLAAYKRGHELGTKQPGWRYSSGQWVRDAERLAALDRKLPAILKGQARPAGAAEWLEFARFCKSTNRYAGAARLYADAFAADPKLADDLRAGHRYNAACYAALAAAGQGADTPKPDDKERARLRGRALGWLRADLAAWAKATDRALTRRKLEHWQKDTDLVGVRDKPALATLPAGERAEWEKLWANIADLLRRLDAGKPAAAPAGK